MIKQSLDLRLISRFFSALLLSAFLFLLCQCNWKSEKADFTYINGAEPQTLDPGMISGQVEMRVCDALFEGLTALNAKGDVEPAVAERWDISEQGTRYTFYLRADVVWSDGRPVTAYDFEKSWKRVLDPETASPYREILFFIKNAKDFNEGKVGSDRVGVRALSDKVLQVDLEASTPFFTDLLLMPAYMPVRIDLIEKYGDAWVKPQHLIGNGAYKLKDWKLNDRIRLVKNPKYWRKNTVKIKTVDVLTVTQASTAFNLYMTGAVDLVLDKSLIPPLLIQEIKNRPDFHTFSYLASYFYRFNVKNPKMENPLVRQALNLAVDKQRLVEKITKAGEIAATGLVPPGIKGYVKAEGLSFNPELAKQKLAEAGFPEGKGFPRLTILYNSSELNEQIATEIQSMWKKYLGIGVDLQNKEWATYLYNLDNLEFEVARSSWVGDYNDPNTFLDCFVSGRGNNRTGWSDKEYDRLIDQANKEQNSQTRFELLRQAETILVEKGVPILPLFHYVGTVLYDPEKIGGIYGNPLDVHPLREMYLKKK